jgi:hypothetical protein
MHNAAFINEIGRLFERSYTDQTPLQYLPFDA